MKKIKRILVMVVILSVILSTEAFANMITWEESPGHHGLSVLLQSSKKTSQDIIRNNARGEILAEGFSEIGNKEDGTIHITVSTLAHRNVDRIFHTVFLDQWDDSRNDWVQVNYFEFEITKEENPNLSSLLNSFTVSGYPVNKYYRVRGLHGVELGDEMEGCATETDGVLITKK